ncbi:MAG: L-aspartate oxidase [Gemmatimonadetes bacterium]|nr:L-aspartate oxidase [Gemmatimonadota bacterium]
MRTASADVLVIGSGIAGLTFALKAAAHASVHVVTKKERAASSTNYAQGGIAAVMSRDDSLDLHVRDTLVAGAGLCHLRAVESLVREGPARVRDLIDWGVRFTASGGDLSLGREGGHSRRRIVHAGDLTGREIEGALIQAVSEHPRISLSEDLHAVDLLRDADDRSGTVRCSGALLLEHRTGSLIEFRAGLVMLATGGPGQAYRHTTNPDIATGDGIAMAYRAGATLANLEFVQFHPTALYPASERAFLISEAVRGEGAVLRRKDGADLMAGVHRHGSLAPRDVVARTIDLELKQSGDDYVLLDLGAISRSDIERRFPGILAECADRGIDIRTEPIPVVPAAHYNCGGVVTDEAGRTSIPGLFAAGEVACTGVHGANRLASNSLLEAVVYSHRAAAYVDEELTRAAATAGQAIMDSTAEIALSAMPPNDSKDAGSLRNELRDLMWEQAGIVRSVERLGAAAARLVGLRGQALEVFHRRMDTETIELRNLVEVSTLIVTCARMRHESRGLHFNIDYPYRDNERFLRDTVVSDGNA